MSILEDSLVNQIAAVGLPTPTREYVFHKPRRWRFDMSWNEKMVAVEVEGASWANGRHNRGSGFEADCIKYCTAAIDGWMVLRVTGTMIKDGKALDFIEQALATEREVQQHDDLSA